MGVLMCGLVDLVVASFSFPSSSSLSFPLSFLLFSPSYPLLLFFSNLLSILRTTYLLSIRIRILNAPVLGFSGLDFPSPSLFLRFPPHLFTHPAWVSTYPES